MESTATVQSENVTVSSNLSYEEQFLQVTGKNFNVYYKKFYNKLVYYIKSMSITELDAEDLAARAFMTSLEKIHQYKPEYQYSTQLFTIGQKLALEYKNKSAKTICIDLNTDIDDENYNPITHSIINKIDDVESTFETQNISYLKYKTTLEEISKLDFKYKQYIELCDIQEKSYREISEILNVPEQTVKNRLHHGRIILEKRTKEQFKKITQHA